MFKTQFGGMGRTGTSPAAQQAVARGVTQAYAPIATVYNNKKEIDNYSRTSSNPITRSYGH